VSRIPGFIRVWSEGASRSLLAYFAKRVRVDSWRDWVGSLAATLLMVASVRFGLAPFLLAAGALIVRVILPHYLGSGYADYGWALVVVSRISK